MSHWLKHLAVALIAILAPIHAVMGTMGALVMIDLLLGVWAAHKRGEKITSAILRRTVSKLVIYQLTVISGFLVEKFLLGELIPVVKLAASAIGLVEIKSILENADAINGSSLFKALINTLGSENDKKQE